VRKRTLILSSLVGIVVLVSLVAVGTYAIFSDNIASDDQTFAAGTVDIQVDEQEEYFETDLDMPNMEPGDCMTQTVTVSSLGSLGVNLWNWIYTWGGDPNATPPIADIFNCDPNPNCNMYVRKEYVAGSADDGEEFIAPGGWEDWKLEACLPLCAGNLCQGGTGTMRMFFHAVQSSNLDGWDCVKLLHKEGPDWIPDPYWDPDTDGKPAHGNKCYQDEVGAGPNVDFVLNGYEMTADMPLQLMLNGPGGCSTEDKIIAGDFNLDGVSENCDLYYRAFWNGTGGTSGAMSCTCDPNTSGEGVYAFAYGGDYGTSPDDYAKTDADGNFSGQWTAYLDACESQSGTYYLKTKFLVKQDADPWLEELDELDYQTIEFTCQ
jgi:predicted ribosomally synthesized peptide with SipW-like signal peptide